MYCILVLTKVDEVASEGDESMMDVQLLVDAQLEDSSAVAEKRGGSPLEETGTKRVKTGEDLEQEDQTLQDEKDVEELWRERRIKFPWLWETDRLLTDPPDVNYRRVIMADQERLKKLLMPGRYPFEERCLVYQEYDVQVERQLLTGHRFWCEHMERDAREQMSEAGETFYEGLGDALREEEHLAKEEFLKHEYDEGVRRGKTWLDAEDGVQRLYHIYLECWLYHDESDGVWHREPVTKGHEYEIRRQVWRTEALAKVKQRYFDCVECQLYCYQNQDQQWHKEGPVYTEYALQHFRYDKEECQYRPPDYVIKVAEQSAALMPSSQEGPKEEAKTESQPSDNNHVKGSIINTRTEIDALLASLKKPHSQTTTQST